MAITNLDQLIAGMRPPVDFLKVGTTMEAVGVFHSLFYASGTPGAAAAPSSGLAGTALTSYAGQIPFTNPISGNSHLARLSASATVAGKLVLSDRLWHNSGLAVATLTAQSLSQAAYPARDRDGGTNGNGVMFGIEVSAATTNVGAIANTTASYTNQAGTAGQTATITSFPATAVAGTFIPFQLAAGDTGHRSIQSITLGTSYGGGAIHVVAYRVLLEIPLLLANVGAAVDAIGAGMPQLYNNSVPFLLWMPTATTAATLTGSLTYAQG
jgi:hypothetical protein